MNKFDRVSNALQKEAKRGNDLFLKLEISVEALDFIAHYHPVGPMNSIAVQALEKIRKEN